MTIGAYLVNRLEQIGLRHIFGVPGDYALTFFDLLEESGIELINTCNELNAGYAADGYARISGIGAVCLTYGVGGFSVYNAVAAAYAERVPLVVISGGPKTTLRSRLHPNLLHHTIGDMNLQRDIYERITQGAVVLTSPTQAVMQIDELLAACLRHSRPVYIEIPADMVMEACVEPGPWAPDMSLHVDEDVLEEALGETLGAITRAPARSSWQAWRSTGWAAAKPSSPWWPAPASPWRRQPWEKVLSPSIPRTTQALIWAPWPTRKPEP